MQETPGMLLYQDRIFSYHVEAGKHRISEKLRGFDPAQGLPFPYMPGANKLKGCKRRYGPMGIHDTALLKSRRTLDVLPF